MPAELPPVISLRAAASTGSTPSQRLPRRRLGEVLVEQFVVTREQLEQALARQADVPKGRRRRRLGAVVIECGFATERAIAEALATALGLSVTDLGQLPISADVVRSLPRPVADRNSVLVLERTGSRVVIATSDPTDVVAVDDVKLHTGATEVQVLVATESQVREHLNRAWSLSQDTNVSTMFDHIDAPDEAFEDSAESGIESAPIVKLVDVIIADAVRMGASDVHVEPQAGELRIRYRIDGLLRDVMTVPRNAAAWTVSRIKIVSGLDISERRRPQDGRAKLTVDGVTVEARVSTLPAVHGEKAVIRLLPRSENIPRLDKTGLTGSQLEAFTTALVQSQGLVLLTGPTGSGKTNTLYAGIQQISTPDRNIVTLEDPVEIQVVGITQVQVHERAGMTFARGLRSVLRQDPDIVLVGEVRDQETAELALQASLTGHLVLTTLHTNDAVSAITRLVDMGVEPFLVASSLTLVVAQRLVRRPCSACVTDYVPSARTLVLLGISEADLTDATPRRGRGCAECGGTGYRGRTGVFEVLPVTAELRHVLLTTPTESAIGVAARAHGMETLRTSALAAAHRGETTYEEVLRATHIDDISGPRCPTCARVLADDMVCCPWDGTAVGANRCAWCDRAMDARWRNCPWCRHGVASPPPITLTEPARLPRLLVIDDDPGVCTFVTAALAGAADVTVVGTGERALAAVGDQIFDGALIDNVLPDMMGIELIRLLRADPRTLTLPLVLFTGTDHPEVERAARQAGADDYLAKPVEPLLLEERVLELIRSTSGRS